MTIFKPQQKTSGYNTISDGIAEDETAAVPFGTTVQTSSSTSTSRRSSTWRIAIVAGLTMIVMAGGAILMLQTTDGGLTTTAVERNRVGKTSCCKKRSDNKTQCHYDNEFKCSVIKGYGGTCHRGMGFNTNCCIGEELGVYHPFDGGCK